MRSEIVYSPRERFVLWTLAAVGFAFVNGAFVYALLQPDVLRQALTNPLALAFLGEAFLLLVAFAYLLTKWGVSRLSWQWFVMLSLLGSMAFALPVVLLWRGRTDRSGSGSENGVA